jgi:DNA-binding ferritin-like protein
MEMLNVVKLYHWKTHSFPEHKNTDQLYTQLNENIDKFVEVLLGKDESRIMKWNKNMQIVQYDNKASFKARIYQYREFLKDLSDILDTRMDSDLLNIRDEILADINQFLYLLTFK